MSNFCCTFAASKVMSNKMKGTKMPPKKETANIEEKNNLFVEAGKFCLDIAKLIFGGVILAGLMKQDIEYMSLFLIGLGVVVIFAFLGFRLIAKSKSKK
jgi:hypothetical protein